MLSSMCLLLNNYIMVFTEHIRLDKNDNKNEL